MRFHNQAPSRPARFGHDQTGRFPDVSAGGEWLFFADGHVLGYLYYLIKETARHLTQNLL